MSVSTAQKVAIAARIAARHAGRNRYLVAGRLGLQKIAVSSGRVLGILWLEVTGFVFLCLAAIGGVAAKHEYAQFAAGKVGSGRFILAIAFSLLFAWFGISSFWRARRKRP
jgi:hypothetical protein